jgi:hypothetical protein
MGDRVLPFQGVTSLCGCDLEPPQFKEPILLHSPVGIGAGDLQSSPRRLDRMDDEAFAREDGVDLCQRKRLPAVRGTQGDRLAQRKEQLNQRDQRRPGLAQGLASVLAPTAHGV